MIADHVGPVKPLAQTSALNGCGSVHWTYLQTFGKAEGIQEALPSLVHAIISLCKHFVMGATEEQILTSLSIRFEVAYEDAADLSKICEMEECIEGLDENERAAVVAEIKSGKEKRSEAETFKKALGEFKATHVSSLLYISKREQ